MRATPPIIALSLALALAAGPARADDEPACGTGAPAPKEPQAAEPPAERGGGEAGAPLAVELFVMSKCPFAAQAEQGLGPVLQRFGDAISFRLDFIGSVENGQPASMHGPSEVEGDKIQLCAAALFPAHFMDLVNCMNGDMAAIPAGWDDCAKKLGLDAAGLGTCFRGPRGQELLLASFERARQSGARGSPTILIGGKPVGGPRTEQAYLRAICNGFADEKPKACAGVPPPVTVPLTLFFDSRCKACQHEGLVAELGTLLPGLKIERVDYATPAGRKRYQDLGLGLLPVLLFGAELKEADAYEVLSRYVEPKGDKLNLKLRGEWDPTIEICDNQVDDDGDDLADCADADCAQNLLCRAEMPGRLEVFVMSQCPYALRALDAMRAVLGQLGPELDFQVHYIASAKGEAFVSLHGQPEVDENIRQLCARAHHAAERRYLDYIWCRNKDIRSDDWRPCAKGNGLDAKRMAACAEGEEGRGLLREDIRQAGELGIGASPTWLVNNRHPFNGIDAETIIQEFCRHNATTAGCSGKRP